MSCWDDVGVVAFVDGLVDSAVCSTADETDDIIMIVDVPMRRIWSGVHFGQRRGLWSLWSM